MAPAPDQTVAMNIHLTDAQSSAVDQIVRQRGKSAAEVVQILIEAGLQVRKVAPPKTDSATVRTEGRPLAIQLSAEHREQIETLAGELGVPAEDAVLALVNVGLQIRENLLKTKDLIEQKILEKWQGPKNR